MDRADDTSLSQLQHEILHVLAERSVSTKYELGQQLGIPWSGVDRVLTGLKDHGLVSQLGVAITLTASGERLARQAQVEAIARRQFELASQQEQAQRSTGAPPYNISELLDTLAQIRGVIAEPYTDHHVGQTLRQIHAGTAIQQAEELIAWFRNQVSA
jgi:DNA-binding MarR family transcriptional regulator